MNLLNTIESCISTTEYDQALLNAEFQVTASKPKVLKLPFAISYHKFEAIVDTGATDSMHRLYFKAKHINSNQLYTLNTVIKVASYRNKNEF